MSWLRNMRGHLLTNRKPAVIRPNRAIRGLFLAPLGAHRRSPLRALCAFRPYLGPLPRGEGLGGLQAGTNLAPPSAPFAQELPTMELRQRLAPQVSAKVTQKVSVVLAQTMHLLALPLEDLTAEVEAALAQHPALETAPERRCPTCGRRLPAEGPCPVCHPPLSSDPQEPIVFLADPADFRPSAPPAKDEAGPLPEEALYTQRITLAEYVLRQIAPELRPEERPIAAYLLTHLDDDGLLTLSPAEAALQTRTSLRQVRRVLHLIQQADPPGVGAASPQEAMLIQLRLLAEAQRPVPPKAEEAVQLGLDLLQPARLSQLARRLGMRQSEARDLLDFIRANLNPYPARAAWGDVHQGQAAPLLPHLRPDIVFSLHNGDPDGPLVVEVLAPGLGLRVNPAFHRTTAHVADTHRPAWQREIQQATLLLKSLRQRHHTLLRLARLLAREQRDFILHGPRHLRPMTRAAVAQRLEVHESTVSRAVSHKSAQLPDGRLIPLSAFFDRSLPARAALKALIAAEMRPLSDSQLARLLSQEMGHRIARRTVAKYRAMEGIPPAHLRHPVPKHRP